MHEDGGEAWYIFIQHSDVFYLCVISHVWIAGFDLPGPGFYHEHEETFATQKQYRLVLLGVFRTYVRVSAPENYGVNP